MKLDTDYSHGRQIDPQGYACGTAWRAGHEATPHHPANPDACRFRRLGLLHGQGAWSGWRL
jgi:hypothetical protein